MKKLGVFSVIACAACLAASAPALGTTVYYGELDGFTSTTDSHLDLNPATKVYAIDVAAASGTTVSNGTYSLTFAGEWPSGASLVSDPSKSHANTPGDGFNPNISGAGAEELKTVLGTMRTAGYWDGSGWESMCGTTISLAVTAGVTYDLQVLMAENYYADGGQRGGSLLLDGVMLVENVAVGSKTGDPLVYHYQFTATGNTIEIESRRAVAGTFSDDSGMVNALTLSTVPEPSAIALVATGVTGLLSYVWRKHT